MSRAGQRISHCAIVSSIGNIMPKPMHEIALAIVFHGDRWLVAKRRHDAHLGGLREFPGGKCLPQETPTQAALRELYEECAVRARPLHVLEAVTWEYADRIVRITPVIACWEAGEPQSLGNTTTRWVDVAELQRLEMPPANAAIIQAALEWRSRNP